MTYAVIAAVTMLFTDVLGTVMVIAEAHEQGWLAGWMDTAQWLVGITTTTITVTALQGHNLNQKIAVIVLVSAANLFGTKLGQMIGSRFVVKTKSLNERIATLERTLASKGHN